MAGRLAGKVAVITGSSRGLGQFCALGYGAEGARVVVAARSEEEKDPRLPGTIYHTAKLIEEAGGEAFPVVCNVADAESIEAMTKAVLDKYGRIDVLMTNAAIQPPGGISTMQPRHWELEFKINVHGVFHCIRAALPSMIEAKSGNIINISSVAAHRGGGHYGATKRAIESMTIGLADEQRENGIAVNSLRPVAAIETPGWMYGRSPETIAANAPRVSPPDSYVEAAILFAMQTATSCSGENFTDAEAVKALGGQESFARFKAMNPPLWSEGL
ncbi:MAG: SDR family NAD(P)-dependent oxidoreductase [Dehalococcoidia bacterium]